MKKGEPIVASGAALFLDRDGVINRRTPGDYVKNLDEFVLEPGAIEAIVFLNKIFARTFVVTNQAGIGKGRMSAGQLDEVHFFLEKKVAEAGGRLDKIYHCPHRPDENCACRKPQTGMAERAKRDFFDIFLEKSWMVGDSASDIELGQRLGMTTVHITGKPEDYEKIESLRPDFQFEKLADFAQFFK